MPNSFLEKEILSCISNYHRKKWPVTSVDYMKKFIKALRGLGFFD